VSCILNNTLESLTDTDLFLNDIEDKEPRCNKTGPTEHKEINKGKGQWRKDRTGDKEREKIDKGQLMTGWRDRLWHLWPTRRLCQQHQESEHA